jgi:tRNA pseudouridine13 synthase
VDSSDASSLVARPHGRIRTTPEDFQVDEIPAYDPAGEGDHVYLHFRKRGLTTDDAVRAIVRALAVDKRETGVAGLKDKAAVTTQWISVLSRAPDTEARARALALEGIEILDVKRHGNKLRTGHLRGNRFTIVVRDVAQDAMAGVRASFDRIAREGVPNAFGTQRFGRYGDTAVRARAWLTGAERAPSDPRARRFQFSAWQSAIFNAVLDARVADGTWTVPLDGDLLKKEETGGLFVCADVPTDRERALLGELCPTGPILGDRMRWPEREARALEEKLVLPLAEGVDLRRARSLGEGTRRVLRLRVTESSFEEVMNYAESPDFQEQGRAFRVGFVLPKGAYATTVLANALEVLDAAQAQNSSPRGSIGVASDTSDTNDTSDSLEPDE